MAIPLLLASSSVYLPRPFFREAQSLSISLEQRSLITGGKYNFSRHMTSASLREMILQMAYSFIKRNHVGGSVIGGERGKWSSFDI
jgi:hypothetical protein